MTELTTVVESPARPLVVVLGGAKVSDKVGVIDRFLEVADQILIGGAMCFSFFRAQGTEIGDSLVEEEGVELAAEALERAKASDCELLAAGRPRPRPRVRRRHRAPRGRRGRGAGRLDGPRRRPDDRASSTPRRSPAPAPCSGTARWAPSRWSRSRPGPGRSPRRSPKAPGTTVVGGGDSVAALRQVRPRRRGRLALDRRRSLLGAAGGKEAARGRGADRRGGLTMA